MPFISRRIYFNPRSLAGATSVLQFLHLPQNYFNPRSLAGATNINNLCFLPILFQSTLPRGSDSIMPTLLTSDKLFQSTLPRGSDSTSNLAFYGDYHFNPRSLAGATASTCHNRRITQISIHAPSRERRYLCLLAVSSLTFQSTLPRGSD